MPLKTSFGLLCAFGAWCAVATSASAQSFAELEARLAEHPSLAALGYQAEASRERSTLASALPAPVFGLGINNFPLFDPSFSEFLPTNKALMVRQEFPNRAGRDARAGEAHAMAQQTGLVREARLAALRAELITLLHDRDRIARQRELAAGRNTRYDELADVVASEIDAGRPAVFRLAEIEAERAGVARMLVDLQRQSAQISARLLDLVGQHPTTAPPPLAPASCPAEPGAYHLVRVAAAALDVADFAIDGAQAAGRPNWGLELTYQQREAGANFAGDDWVSGMVTVSVPLRSERSVKPRLRAAKAERTGAKMRVEAAARSAIAQCAAEDAARRAAAASIKVLERNIAAVKDEMVAQLTVYESGLGDYAPIIDGDIATLSLRADIAAEQSRLAAATARIQALQVMP